MLLVNNWFYTFYLLIHCLLTAFCQLPASSRHCASLLDQLITKSSVDLMPYRNVLVCNLARVLDSGVSRHCQDLVQRIWFKMNGLFSTKLAAFFLTFLLNIFTENFFSPVAYWIVCFHSNTCTLFCKEAILQCFILLCIVRRVLLMLMSDAYK